MAKGRAKHGKKKPAARNHNKRTKRSAPQSTTEWTGEDLKTQLRQRQLCIKDVTGDGNCLFRALSDQYYGTDAKHKKIRQEVCEYLKQHEDTYKHFVEDDQSFDHHIKTMQQDGTYGGNMELAAFARMKRVDIKIYQPGMIYIIKGKDEDSESEEEESEEEEEEEERPPLHIAYHSWEHYSSIRNIDGPFTGPPEIKDHSPNDSKRRQPASPHTPQPTRPLTGREKKRQARLERKQNRAAKKRGEAVNTSTQIEKVEALTHSMKELHV